MKVADTNASCNPTSNDVKLIRDAIQTIDAIADRLKATVFKAAKNSESFDTGVTGVPTISMPMPSVDSRLTGFD